MEKWVEQLFNDDILKKAAGKYGADSTEAKKLGDFENYVFEVTKDSKPFILRLTHSSHRSMEEVEAELDWINFLHANGLNVSLAHTSENRRLVEQLDVGDSSFFVSMFDKAPGELVKMQSDLFGSKLFTLWGKVTGKMHKVTQSYEARSHKRLRWDDNDLIDFHLYMPEQKLIAEADKLVNIVKALPQSPDVFNLIHSDIHPGNFFYNEGEIHVFDFDDSSYHYLVSDIAIPLYYSVWFVHRDENLQSRSAFGAEMLYHFLVGYLEEYEMSDDWLKRIPLFLKLRDYELYSVFHKKFDLQNMSDREKAVLNQLKERLLTDELIVQLEYDNLIQKVRKK
ncbi:phosphotransferase enzyme family protein [Bacillus sp. FJAT-45066]|uniref:phosphotransferase enzyme family protein n=1 Tax=Bacillus sp. FJAT-45066 TaxID=2011010 RepID=UPI000BB88422|nr:phosphotransferase [Bacillus sp. FJAT-45066]